MTYLYNAASQILDTAIQEHNPSHVFAMFSGGHDSLCSTYIAAQHPRFTAAVHINTGIGIEDTREFVRETCREQGWPLLEYHPDGQSYEDLVLRHGFGRGPKAHSRYYYWLKQRQIRRLVAEYKTHRHDRIALVTGIRELESHRRMASNIAAEVRRDGAQLWVNPILHWSKADCNQYIAGQGLKRNQVSDLLHRSGECLCGALARRDELRDIALWFPDTAHRIRQLERQAAERGVHAQWATPEPIPELPGQESILPLCVGCEARADS